MNSCLSLNLANFRTILNDCHWLDPIFRFFDVGRFQWFFLVFGVKIAVEGSIKCEDFLDGQRLPRFVFPLRRRIFRPIALAAPRVEHCPFGDLMVPLEFLELLLGDEGIGVNALHAFNFLPDALHALVPARIHDYDCG